MKSINEIKVLFAQKIVDVSCLEEIKQLNVEFLGKKGHITELLKELKNMSGDDKRDFAQKVNELKVEVAEILDQEKEVWVEKELNEKLKSEMIDITKPGFFIDNGNIHPLTAVSLDIINFFVERGYDVIDGPEVETDEINFSKLNIPEGHSARDMQDSFYVSNKYLLRTHTSPMQIRYMLNSTSKSECKIISPGKVYRRDEDDATHSHQFMQIEGLVIDKNVSLSNLKYVLENLLRTLFGIERSIRMRPSYFPFTEPSMEVDIDCFNCNGKGCNICKGTGWIEILGCGMIHPNVLENCGYDKDVFNGFAFGLGVERIAMLKYNIADIRSFYTNNVRFIREFKSIKGGY